MRPAHVTTYLFAIALAAIGALNIAYGDFGLQWQPVPASIPARHQLALASGVFLLVCAAGHAFPRTRKIAIAAVLIYLALWVLLLQGPRVLANPVSIGAWLGFAENFALVMAALIPFAAETDRLGLVLLARVLFGLACIEYGLSHFAYADFTATMVPAWLPARLGLAYLAGTGHAAAGIAIILGVVPRLAATMEAAMMSSFVLLVHIPGVARAPSDRLQWTMLVFAFALAASAWVVAGSLQARPWLGRQTAA